MYFLRFFLHAYTSDDDLVTGVVELLQLKLSVDLWRIMQISLPEIAFTIYASIINGKSMLV